MRRDTEIGLATELLELHAARSAFLDESTRIQPVAAYHDEDRFMRERAQVIRTTPQPAVHSSELPAAGDFLRREVAGLPVLFTRDSDGIAHAFLNVCRHRGTRLVEDANGCRQRFSCPYHAWTWNNRGELLGMPHAEQGFPGLNREALGLRRLGCTERHGWLWVQPDSEEAPDMDAHLGELTADFAWFESDDFRLLHSDEQVRAANWKLIVEGGLEAYHFRVAHRDTIGPYFLDNLSTYQCYGRHLRSVLARRTLAELRDQPTEQWRLRDHAQVLYTLFPVTSLLVQSDHCAWIRLEPLSAGSTRIRINTLVPRDRMTDPDDLAHWARNHQITLDTLDEDFDIGERIQAGLDSGANEHLTFGRFEGALAAFNDSVEAAMRE